jgi:hypothetical protein
MSTSDNAGAIVKWAVIGVVVGGLLYAVYRVVKPLLDAGRAVGEVFQWTKKQATALARNAGAALGRHTTAAMMGLDVDDIIISVLSMSLHARQAWAANLQFVVSPHMKKFPLPDAQEDRELMRRALEAYAAVWDHVVKTGDLPQPDAQGRFFGILGQHIDDEDVPRFEQYASQIMQDINEPQSDPFYETIRRALLQIPTVVVMSRK